MLAGSGLSWRAGETHEVRAGDCLVYRPDAGAHTLIAGDEPLDVLAFGERRPAELAHLPRAGVLWAGPSWVADAVAAGHPWEREVEAGRAADARAGLAAAGLDRAPRRRRPRGRRAAGPAAIAARRLGVRCAARVTTGLRHVTIAPGTHGWPRHCHAAEEELFVILGGSGHGAHRRRGGARARRARRLRGRPGTGLAHSFRAGPGRARVPRLRAARHRTTSSTTPTRARSSLAGRRRDRAHRAARLLGRRGRARAESVADDLDCGHGHRGRCARRGRRRRRRRRSAAPGRGAGVPPRGQAPRRAAPGGHGGARASRPRSAGARIARRARHAGAARRSTRRSTPGRRIVALWIAGLPFALLGWRAARRAGLSRQRLPGWFGDQAKSLAIGAVLAPLVDVGSRRRAARLAARLVAARDARARSRSSCCSRSSRPC